MFIAVLIPTDDQSPNFCLGRGWTRESAIASAKAALWCDILSYMRTASGKPGHEDTEACLDQASSWKVAWCGPDPQIFQKIPGFEHPAFTLEGE